MKKTILILLLASITLITIGCSQEPAAQDPDQDPVNVLLCTGVWDGWERNFENYITQDGDNIVATPNSVTERGVVNKTSRGNYSFTFTVTSDHASLSTADIHLNLRRSNEETNLYQIIIDLIDGEYLIQAD